MLSQILIEVDDMLNINVHCDDKAWLAVALLWGLDVARQVLLEKIARSSKTTASGGEREVSWEIALKKEEAIGVYLKAWKLIESRIKAINKADDQSEFAVNKSLLDKL